MFSSNNSQVTSDVTKYIEEVFSTHLYTGNGSTQTITNGIDLSTKGGLVWTKARDAAEWHSLCDTARGVTSQLSSNSSGAAGASGVTQFNSNGYATSGSQTNLGSTTYASWTFRKQAKFFDIVTYTGDGNTNQTIPHNLGSTPGCIIIKAVNDGNGWYTYHRGLTTPNNYNVYLNATAAQVNQGSNVWNVTSTTFQANQPSIDSNKSGINYVAYLFAHDAGGFGLTGTDNVISCGSYTGNGSTTGPVVTLGYEPQWVMIKNASSAQNWYLIDNMRGMPVGDADANLIPNTSSGESASTILSPTATGFQLDTAGSPNQSGETFIYIAIRRGPMKVPTSGTSVFSPEVQTPTGGANNNMAANSGFPIDWLPTKQKGIVSDWYQTSRLTNNYMSPNTTAAEGAYTYGFDRMAGVGGGSSGWNTNSTVSYAFRRAPGFFDVVCATSIDYAVTATHNLGVVPELIIAKNRNTTSDWYVWSSLLSTTQTRLRLNSTNASASLGFGLNSVTASSFYAATGNTPTATQVFFLFATCAGVSKVGSYTGTGATQTINCGFTTGARFVLIKITNTTGNWYVYDTARGMTVGTNPSLFFNSTSAEDPGSNISTTSVGFTLAASPYYPVNSNGYSYIFLAIA